MHAESIQGFDGRRGFSRIGHFNEGKTARSAGVTVLQAGDGFNGSEGREKVVQRCFCGRRIQVSNEDIRHIFWQTFQSGLRLPVKGEKAISVAIASLQNPSATVPARFPLASPWGPW
jgi:hypothetical protein